MMSYLKNVWTYHLIADGPLLLFAFYMSPGEIPRIYWLLPAVIYPFIYRPIIDYYRLLALGEIKEKDFPKMWKWAGFYRFKYYSKLMFG